MGEEPLYLSCHCQAHILQIHQPAGRNIAELMKDAKVDDCSICVKRRCIWYHLPNPKVRIEIIRGFGKDGVDLLDYSFATRKCAHQVGSPSRRSLKTKRTPSWASGLDEDMEQSLYQSCKKCGTFVCAKWIAPSPKAEELFMINMRALRDPELRLDDYTFLIQDTSRDDPQYTHVQIKDIPDCEEYLNPRRKVYDFPMEIYAGSCHCQAVKFAVICKPLEEIKILDCTCSICRGNGPFWIYPGRRNVFFEKRRSPETPWSPDESLTDSYEWGDFMLENWQCKVCKCTVYWSSAPDDDPVPHLALDHEEQDEAKEIERVGSRFNYGWNQWLGLNAALLTDINKYVGDVHNTHPEGSERDAPKGMKGKCTNKMGFEDPIYHVKV